MDGWMDGCLGTFGGNFSVSYSHKVLLVLGIIYQRFVSWLNRLLSLSNRRRNTMANEGLLCRIYIHDSQPYHYIRLSESIQDIGTYPFDEST